MSFLKKNIVGISEIKKSLRKNKIEIEKFPGYKKTSANGTRHFEDGSKVYPAQRRNIDGKIKLQYYRILKDGTREVHSPESLEKALNSASKI